MKKITWKRINPGWYRGVGPDGTLYWLANMKGQSIRYSGTVIDPWHLSVGGSDPYGAQSKSVGKFETKADAQAHAEEIA